MIKGTWLIKTTDDEEMEAPRLEIQDIFLYLKATYRMKTMHDINHKWLFWKKPETITAYEDKEYIFYILPKLRVHSITWVERPIDGGKKK